MSELGNIDNVCPYCSRALSKRPQRKSTCPHCGSVILVRTRPSDRNRVLVTEEQAKRIEEQWNEILSTPECRVEKRPQFDAEKKMLAKKLGSEPSDHDVLWSIFNKELVASAREQKWGLYRNTLFEMGELLMSESKWSGALNRYFEVCYLDLNGPTNYGDTSDLGEFREIVGELKPFEPDEHADFPGILRRIEWVAKHSGLNLQAVQQRFLEVATRLQHNLKLPLPSETAWVVLERELSQCCIGCI